jgi:CRP-like cAMP-binding protein
MTESGADVLPDWLSGQHAHSVLAKSQRRRVPANTSLCQEGQITDRCFLVIEGTVAASKQFAGQTHRLSVFGPGCLLALMPAIDGAPCALTISALSDAKVIEISREDLLAVISRHEENDAQLADHLSLLAIRRLRNATDQLAQAIYCAISSPEHKGHIDAMRLARIQANGYIWLDS